MLMVLQHRQFVVVGAAAVASDRRALSSIEVVPHDLLGDESMVLLHDAEVVTIQPGWHPPLQMLVSTFN
ncbi:TPA: hypothetical protein PGG59_005179 [Raoultella planticola]|nr:hypothetical protein [Raoultella planticola]